MADPERAHAWKDPLEQQRLVGSIAKRYRNRGIEFEDLKQIGYLGLLRAIRDYDHTRSAFTTYATEWIEEAISNAIRNQARPIRIPQWVRTRINKGARPDDPGLTPKCRECIRAALRVLDANREDLDLFPLAAPEAVEPERDFEVIAPRLAKLPERDRLILSKRFGLDGEPPRSRSQIGESLRLTRERIRQIEVKALERLRETA